MSAPPARPATCLVLELGIKFCSWVEVLYECAGSELVKLGMDSSVHCFAKRRKYGWVFIIPYLESLGVLKTRNYISRLYFNVFKRLSGPS